MLKASLKSGASSFAHLFGRPAASAKAKAEDEKEKDKDQARAEDESDEKEDSDKDDKKTKKTKKAKAESEDEGDDDDDDQSAEADDADDDDDDEHEQDAAAKGASAERTRWVSTLSNQAAAGKGEAAIHMLATTDMSAAQIVGVLGGLPSSGANAGRRSLDSRMRDRQAHNPGAGDAQEDGPNATAKAMMAVYDRVSGKGGK